MSSRTASGDQRQQRRQQQQEAGGQDAVLDALRDPAPAVERALEQADHGQVADLGDAQDRHAAGRQLGNPADVDREMAQIAQGALDQVAAAAGQGQHDLVDLAAGDAPLEIGEALQGGDARRPAAVERAVEIERHRDAQGGIGAGEAGDGPGQMLAEPDHGDVAGQRAGGKAAEEGELEHDTVGHQGDGTADEPGPDPQARDVLGDLEREQDRDQRRHGQRPAGEQTRHLPAQGDEAARRDSRKNGAGCWRRAGSR